MLLCSLNLLCNLISKYPAVKTSLILPPFPLTTHTHPNPWTDKNEKHQVHCTCVLITPMCDQVDLISVHQMYPHIVRSGFRRLNTPIPSDVWSQVQGSNVCKPKQCVSTVMRRFVERLMCLNPVKDFTGSEQPLKRVEEEGSVFSSRGGYLIGSTDGLCRWFLCVTMCSHSASS